MSCEDFMSNFVGPAGCAESCDDDTKKDGFRDFCGEGGSKGSRGGGSKGSMGSIGSKGGSGEGPPPCAMSCDRPPMSCEDFWANFVGPAGCAESCDEDTKKEGHKEFCGEGGSKGSRGGGSKGSMGSIG